MVSDGKKILELNLFEMEKKTIHNLKDFMENNNLEKDTRNESELQRVYNYKIYPRDSITTTVKGCVIIDNGKMGGSHWTCYLLKDNKSFYFGSFEGQRYKFLIN